MTSTVVLYKWVGGNAAGWWEGLVRDDYQIKKGSVICVRRDLGGALPNQLPLSE